MVTQINSKAIQQQDWQENFRLSDIDKRITLYLADHQRFHDDLKRYQENMASKKPRTYEDLAQTLLELEKKNDIYNYDILDDTTHHYYFPSDIKEIYGSLKQKYGVIGKFTILDEPPYSTIFKFSTSKGEKVLKLLTKEFANHTSLLTGELFGLKLSHPNLLKTESILVREEGKIKVLTQEKTDVSDRAKFVGCIMEYEGLQDLELLLRRLRLTEEETKPIIYEILQGVLYMHKEGLMHRDLKLENILGRKVEKSDKRISLEKIKICDFGFTIGEEKKNCVVGSRGYLAPEIFWEEDHDKKVDIWCLGILIFICIQGHYPINDPPSFNEEGTHISLLDPYRKSFTSMGYDLLTKLLQQDPQKRPSAEEILQHPWFDSIKNKKR